MSSGIIKHIENTQRPLIGLEYIAILVNDDNTHFREFRCMACRVQVKSLLMRHILKHVESVEHQLTYLVSRIRVRFTPLKAIPYLVSFPIYFKQILHFPTVSGDLYRTHPPIKQRTVYVYAICDAIERTYGRMKPHCLKSDQYHRSQCPKMTHFDESMGDDFMEVLDKCRYNCNFSFTHTSMYGIWMFSFYFPARDLEGVCMVKFHSATITRRRETEVPNNNNG